MSTHIVQPDAGPTYAIAPARPDDVSQLPAIELAAAKLLTGHAPESVLTETTSLDTLRAAQRDGRLWVVLADDRPVGFAHLEIIEPIGVHLEEIDVHPDHGRRGLGRKLVESVCTCAATAGHRWVTLSTFRDVRWNMPFYASLGFTVVPWTGLSPALRKIVRDEARRGLDMRRRVVMRRLLTASQR